MSTYPVIGFTIVALLVFFLLLRYEERLGAKRMARERAGKGFDPAPISQRLEQVRRDYVAVVCARPRNRDRRRRLHAAANCALKRRAYFHDSFPTTREPPPRETTTPPL